MSTKPDRKSGRGDYLKVVAVLGVVMLAVGLGLPRVSALSGFWSGFTDGGNQKVAAASATSTPYVVEPSVRFEQAKPRVVRPRPAKATGVPTRIVIPKLGVDSPVVAISVTGGTLLPPNDPQMLGWWNDGAKPGAVTGGALITGHTVHTGGGAFDHLARLKPRDRVTVHTSKGSITYSVSGVTIYEKASLAKDARKVFSQEGPGRLVLITCDDWNGTEYLSNAVVFADRVGAT